MLDHHARNLTYALRALGRSPGFTAVAVLTLALGIGTTTAIFSVVHAVVLDPLPFPDAQRLVRVWPRSHFTNEQVAGLREHATTLELPSSWTRQRFSLSGGERPEEIIGSRVSANHFSLFGVAPMLGRGFREEDERPGAPAVVVLSYELWQRRFGADRAILGETAAIDGYGEVAKSVIGITPPGYRPFGHPSELWVPETLDPGDEEAWSHMANLRVVARLRPAATTGEAAAELRNLAARLWSDYDYLSEERIAAAGVSSHLEALVGDVRRTLFLLLGAVGLTLLIACANVANLLLARAAGREQELAIRNALGAGRREILAQLMTESLALGLLGGIAGLLAAGTGVASLRRLLPAGMPRSDEIAVDPPVLAFALAVSLGASLLFGLAPALRSAARTGHLLRDRSGTRRPSHHRLNQALVAVEVALAVVLVIGAGLLIKSLWRLQRAELGFDAEQVLTLRLAPPQSRYVEEEHRASFYRAVLERVETLPGVVAAGATSLLPASGQNMMVTYTTAENPGGPGERPPFGIYTNLTPGYLEALRIPVVAGRDIDAGDRAGTRPVGLVNESLAREHWGSAAAALGKEILDGDGNPWFTVVGAVADLHQAGARAGTGPQLFIPYDQEAWLGNLTLTVRLVGDPLQRSQEVQEAVWQMDPNVAISGLAPMRGVLRDSLAGSRFTSVLFSLFAGLALLLGGVGIYGVTAYITNQRIREIGIRMALGASGRAVLSSTMGRALLPVGIGLGAGLVAAVGGARLLESLLFEVEAADPAVLLGVVLGLGTVAALASYEPARRAAAVDPMAALGRD